VSRRGYSIVEFELCPATTFGAVHGAVGTPKKLFWAKASLSHSNANTGAHGHLYTGDHKRLGESVHHAARYKQRTVSRAQVLAQRYQFVAPKARKRVFGAKHQLEPGRRLNEDLVTSLVAVGVIDRLEVVEVDK
jgi:hypothetical protein